MSDLTEWPTDKRVQFSLPIAPVSQQAPGDSRRAFKLKVEEQVRVAEYLLSGDIELQVEWSVSEQARYESDRTPDVDNILKPLIDALAGPGGLLIDDNQIQRVTCSWHSSRSGAESVDVLLLFSKDAWVPKEKPVFVRFQNGLCLPIPHTESREKKLKRFYAYSNRLAARAMADGHGLPYHHTKMLMPEQRVFHRTRLTGFVVLTENEFLESLPPEA